MNNLYLFANKDIFRFTNLDLLKVFGLINLCFLVLVLPISISPK